MQVTKTGKAEWTGDLKTGKGAISTESGALDSQPFGFNTRFEGKAGTNPEELIGAAHAACFSMALSKALEDAGIKEPAIETKSEITLESQGQGFAITKAHLVTKITASGDEAAIRKAAEETKSGCPVSKVLNAEVTMDASIQAA